MKDWQDNEQERENVLFSNRIKEQEENLDFNEERERCNDCNSLLNSHDHCPRCDY